MVLLAPQVVEGADSHAEAVDPGVRVLVQAERQSVDDLRGQAGVGHQQSARRDVVVRERDVEESVDVQRWRRRRWLCRLPCRRGRRVGSVRFRSERCDRQAQGGSNTSSRNSLEGHDTSPLPLAPVTRRANA